MYTRNQISTARKIARSAGVNSLLTGATQNPKVEKNAKKLGILTAPLHLAPSKLSGYQVCAMASEACIRLCLHTAGNPQYMAAKNKARIARTKLFFEDRDTFMTLLYAAILLHTSRAKKKNMFAGIRLNATSDLPWEAYKFANGQTVFEAFPDVSFYDYTKIEKRMLAFLRGTMPKNYYLTFSATESNWNVCEKVLAAGGTVAVPVNVKRGQDVPSTYRGYPVIDGDIHDYRPSDTKGHVIALRAKGAAIGDTSGFVHTVSISDIRKAA